MAIIKPNNNTISAITALPAAITTGSWIKLAETKKTSGKQKLKDLGLDDDEIKALMGA